MKWLPLVLLAVLFCSSASASLFPMLFPEHKLFYPADINGGSYWLTYLKVGELDVNTMHVTDVNIIDYNVAGDGNFAGSISVVGNAFLSNVNVAKDLNVSGSIHSNHSLSRVSSICKSGTESISFGYLTWASGNNSAAFGWSTIASGFGSMASGLGALASGIGSFATGNTSIGAEGGETIIASGDGSFAWGAHTAYGSGETTIAKGDGSMAGGFNNFAHIESDATGAIALGYSDVNLYAGGIGSIALGYNCSALSEASICLGKNLTNYKANSVLVQDLNVMQDINVGRAVSAPIYFGDGSKLTGISSAGDANHTLHTAVPGNAFLTNVNVAKDLNVSGKVWAKQDLNVTNDINAGGTVKGAKFRSWNAIDTEGINAVALGSGTSTYGDYSTALGLNTTAFGAGSLSTGWVEDHLSTMTASGDGSITLGFCEFSGTTTASGAGAIATGSNSAGTTTAQGDGSVVMGFNNGGTILASGQGSVAMGYALNNIISSGDGSIALGYNCSALEEASVCLGKDLTNYKANSVLVQDLNALQDINAGRAVYAPIYFGDGSKLTGIASGGDANHTASTSVPQNSFLSNVNVAKDLNVGKNIKMAGRLTNAMGANDVNGLEISQLSYTGTIPLIVGIISTAVNTADSNTNQDASGLTHNITNNHKVNGTSSSGFTQLTTGITNNVSSTGEHSQTVSAGGMIDTTTGIKNNIASGQGTRTITATPTSFGNITLNYIGIDNALSTTQEFIYTGKTLYVNSYGIKNNVYASTSPVMGSTVTNNYGEHITVSGSTVGTSTNYGLYLDAITSADILWGFYNNTTAAHNLLGKDNVKTYFGTGADATIYYDATNLIINPKDVGSGDLRITGDTNVYGDFDTNQNAFLKNVNVAKDLNVLRDLNVTGRTKSGGGFTNRVVCWKNGDTLGYCSSIVGVNGDCTCN